jgi:hypothetical protein
MELSHVDSKIIQWHHDKNLIDGATDWTQTRKLFEEFIELVASQHPGRSSDAIGNLVCQMLIGLMEDGRIKSVSKEDAETAKLDAIGDMYVVMANIAERNKSSMETCANMAWNEIKDRTGKMINGTFVKESDLSNT